ncbi:MAG: cupin domain-containing protein [Candidatus Heimdallarchaeota archaeon]|nr:cupin domain-containing protein [Candidatus Heimdallarchaeota archaeon]
MTIETNIPKVEVFVDLINYQEESVVSRQIIKKKTGNVTLFAFDSGEGLSEHTTPFDALAFILDGNAIITIAEKEYHVKKGEFIIMPANVPHSLKAWEQFKMLLIMIKED